MTSPVALELLDAIRHALPRAQDVAMTAVERHALRFLERLLEQARRDGPDGEVLRNQFDMNLLETVIVILREFEL